ncbi:hypothetical protein HNP87_001451 [Methanococcus maripaludis]|uniref:NurA domain-containing protein n=1 Tax=Methanococcus maripaludis TaxID=39152 RepID=A0A7J9NKW0_METMI|nr:hypothetical protein [Methanococcus maripaludis]MBA2840919.1 hypothetical protein [Methanococcus maripaludis]
MPSQISETLEKYKRALENSKDRYEKIKKDRFENSKSFYDNFFNGLIKTYDEKDFNRVKLLAEQFFQVDKVKFAAVDGSCYKKQLQDYMVFFGAAYPVRGYIDFSKSDKFVYEDWSPEEDVSMVAYVPIPFAELDETVDDPFVLSDDQKTIDLSNIHVQLMELAEVYQAYMLVKSSDLRPKILLWDQSMSSVMNSNEVMYNKVDLVGYKYQRTSLTEQDIILAYSHPYSDELSIPSKKKYHVYNHILYKLQKEGPQDISKLSKELKLTERELKTRISYLINSIGGKNPIVTGLDQNKLIFNEDYEDSWEYVVGLFEHICHKIFKEQDPNALVYNKKNSSGEKEERWMSPNDLRFLISVGVRALIENCWKHDVLLIGIVKDSSSRYLTRNYVGVMQELNKYQNIPQVLLPWSDRDFLEILPWVDDNITAPWSTIEFDSVFMTLHVEKDEKGNKRIQGVRGDIVAPSERLFARSLAQFYLNRSKRSLLYGHVIFIDRLITPKIDKKLNKLQISNEKILGDIEPYLFSNNCTKNEVQDLMVYILNLLTKNLYPEVIGYPDPLHKADWGAKSIYKRIRPIIDSSDISLRANPTNKTFRQLRDQIKRT